MQTFTLEAIRTQYPNVFPSLVKQLQQPYCSRCGGTMVEETCMDIFSDYEDFQFQAQHCIQCGDVIDPFILLNRMKLHSAEAPEMISFSRKDRSGHESREKVMTK